MCSIQLVSMNFIYTGERQEELTGDRHAPCVQHALLDWISEPANPIPPPINNLDSGRG